MKWLPLFLVLIASSALAVQPNEMLQDPKLEARAREISKDLRCLVCQNQSIDDSDADLARDLRVLLRQRLVAGDSNAQAKQYLVDRYGDYVLLKPPFNMETLVLWVGPFALLLIGGVAAFSLYRRRSAPEVKALTPEEQAKIDRFLAD
jgi:cytochrome c-type biogenesis protein CcmH